MKLLHFALLSAGAMAMAGCDNDVDPIVAPDVPLAATRYVNAMPDTLGTTWRFVDQLELSPVFIGLDFRQFSPYQPTAVGSRPLKVFVETTDIDHVHRTFTDTTLTLEDGKRYTFVQVGMARTGSTPPERLFVIEDVFPTVAANQVADRFIHTGAGLGPIDIYSADALTGTATPATPLVSGLEYLEVSPYVAINATANTGLATIGATTTGYTRTEGSFITDGFRVGPEIAPSRFLTAANNGRATVTAVTATTLTVTKASGTTANEAAAPGRLIMGEMTFRATNAGTTTVVAQLRAPTGVPGEPGELLEPIGGTGIPGSILSAFLMPRSVSGSPAASFSTPSFVYLVDKHPR